jgi:hypothetical protein
MSTKFNLLMGTTLLSFVFFLFLLAAIGFFAGISISGAYVGLALIMTFYFSRKRANAYFGAEAAQMLERLCVIAAILFTVFFVLSNSFYDVSYDGQVYHQEAVQQLANGWNPVWHYLSRAQSPSAVLLNHYAKGPWIYEAVLYKATGQMEGSKVFNFILLAASFFLTLAATQRWGKFSAGKAVAVSLVLALNPVSVYQLLSFYIDGQLASLLLCFLSLGYLLIQDGEWRLLPEFATVVGLAVNVKFTGVVYVIFGMGLFAGWLYFDGRRRLTRDFVGAMAGTVLLGVVLLGYNPYVTNTVFFGHPFYPLYGAGARDMDIMTKNSPPSFLREGMLEKLCVATFSMSSNQFDTQRPVLKLPFSFSLKELRPFVYGADIRLGGFGPWYSGMLLLAAFIWLAMVNYGLKERMWGLLWVAGILLSVLINPEAWWARYVPQFWLVPVVTAALALQDHRRLIVVLGKGLLVVSAVNILMVGIPYFIGNYDCTQSFNQQLKILAQAPKPLRICLDEFASNRIILNQAGLQWVQTAPNETADVSMDYVRYDYLTAIQREAPLAIIFKKDTPGVTPF